MESIRGLFLGIEVSEQSEVLSQISEMFEDLCSGIKFVNSYFHIVCVTYIGGSTAQRFTLCPLS